MCEGQPSPVKNAKTTFPVGEEHTEVERTHSLLLLKTLATLRHILKL